MKVYWLRPYRDWETLKAYRRAVASDLDETDEVYKRISQARGRPLEQDWQPVEVRIDNYNKQLPLLDFSGQSGLLIVTKDVIKNLGDVLTPLGEYLPLQNDEVSFYIYYPTPWLDMLNIENSSMRWLKFAEDPVAFEAKIYSFHPDKLKGVEGIFCVPQLGLRWYHATDAFKRRYEAAGLTGLEFYLVWDSENPEYQDERWGVEQWQRIKRSYPLEKDRRPEDKERNIPKSTSAAPDSTLPTSKEQPLNTQDRESVIEMTRAAVSMLNRLENLNLTPEKDPKLLVETLYAASEALRHQTMPQEELENRAIELGVLWGEQVCRAYGWHWAKIEDEFAVVAPDASLYVYPVPLVYQFFEDTTKDTTVLLLFNMLASPKTDAKPGDYIQIA